MRTERIIEFEISGRTMPALLRHGRSWFVLNREGTRYLECCRATVRVVMREQGHFDFPPRWLEKVAGEILDKWPLLRLFERRARVVNAFTPPAIEMREILPDDA